MRSDSLEFENATQACREVLAEVASKDENDPDSLMTYGLLSRRLADRGYKVPPHEGPMPHLLERASRLEHSEGRGLISALVVMADTHLPGQGFFKLARSKPFLRRGDDITLWFAECRRLRSEHSSSYSE
jgi:hypothetical protein